jgi:hypothetical protein
MHRTIGVVVLLVVGSLAPMAHTYAGSTPTSCFDRPTTNSNDTPGATISGTGGPDLIYATGAYQTIDAYGGDDVICSTGYGSVVRGGSGSDLMFVVDAVAIDGGAGDDNISANTTEAVWGGSGNDLLILTDVTAAYGGPGQDTFDAIAVDSCDGGSGTDRFKPNFADCGMIASIP